MNVQVLLVGKRGGFFTPLTGVLDLDEPARSLPGNGPATVRASAPWNEVVLVVGVIVQVTVIQGLPTNSNLGVRVQRNLPLHPGRRRYGRRN